MGKYSHITGRLDPVPIRDPKAQEKVDFVKDKVLSAGDEPDWLVALELFEEHAAAATSALDTALSLATRDGHRDIEPQPRAVEDHAKAYKMVRVMHDQFTARVKSFDILLEAYKQITIDELEARGMSSVRFVDGSSVSTEDLPYAVVNDSEKMIQWLRDNNQEEMLSVNWQRLNAHVKECLLNETEEPDGVTAYTMTKLVFRKGNG